MGPGDHAAHAEAAAHADAAGGGGLAAFFSQEWFMPHGHCYLWKPHLVGLHVGSDTLIGLAYVGISLILWYLVKRVRLPFTPMFLAFGLFIGACGLTHFVSVWNVWNADYWFAGFVKLLTAVASVATAAFLLPMRARVVSVATAAQLSESRRVELESKNRELEALYEQVKQLDEARTAFFANVSHELRTPLSLVLGPVERLLGDPATSPGCRETLVTVQRNAQVLLKQVNTLLEAAKLEAGELRLEASAVDLAAVFRLSSASFESMAVGRGVRFSADLPEQLWVVADADKLQQVVLNLLSNAFKFAPDDGEVRLTLARTDGGVRLTVADSGPGVPPAWRERIFERFSQVDAGDTRRRGGTGLGLAIARDLVELHGGTIRVLPESALGGAELEVQMPLPEVPRAPGVTGTAGMQQALAERAQRFVEEVRPPAAAAETEAPVGPGGDVPKVLVVEDNPDLRHFLRDTLAGELEVHLAADGREGLARAQVVLPDVILTDLMMPNMSGAELVAQVRAREELENTQIILLTARDEEGLRVSLLEQGAQDFVGKPFNATELRARVVGLAKAAKARSILQRAVASGARDVDELAAALERRTRELEVALQAARAAREEAERSSEVKSTFLSLISHELRTPLTAIHLNAESTERMLQRAGTAPPPGLQRIRDGARRLYELVDAVLEFIRVESGRLTARSTEVDVADVAQQVAADLLHEAQRKLLRLSAETPEADAALHTDPRLLRLILSNLVVNAVKFTHEGEVTVRVRPGADAVVVEVADTGPGIPHAERERIFEPFVQLEDMRHKSEPGVGLGLSLVQRMADALGARVELESAPGKGSTFRVILPRRGREGDPG